MKVRHLSHNFSSAELAMINKETQSLSSLLSQLKKVFSATKSVKGELSLLDNLSLKKLI